LALTIAKEPAFKIGSSIWLNVEEGGRKTAKVKNVTKRTLPGGLTVGEEKNHSEKTGEAGETLD